MKHIALLFVLAMPFDVFCQNASLFLARDQHLPYEAALSGLENDFHTGIKPFNQRELRNVNISDSLQRNNYLTFKKPLQKAGEGNSYGNFSLSAVATLVQGSDSKDTADASILESGLGLAAQLDLGKRFSLTGNFEANNSGYPRYYQQYIDQWGVVPGMGREHGTSLGSSFTYWEAHAHYSPSQYFNFSAGRGKHFLGEGYRSLLWSDNANSYPYLRVESNFWKFKYVNLFTALSDIAVGNTDATLRKYAAVHYLSWNATRRLNISFFEALVWPGQDSLLQRGFDIGYLNPVIFYRPVEYAIGSADNALMGLSGKLRITNSLQGYGQLILDEFLLKELRDNRGWWANKYGLQAGMKYFNVGGVENLHLQGELNFVRPFTYSHGNPVQNYGHFNQPLAHPMGANFYEAIGIVNYRYGNFGIEEKLNIGVFGTDTSSVSYGGNIYIPYQQRDSEYGHTTAQGLRNTLVNQHLRVWYLLDVGTGMRVELGHQLRRLTNDQGTQTTNFVYLGIRSALFNRYRDF